MNTHDVISRCTRNGHTAWQQVACQLGCSVDSVRAQFDPTYMRAHIWAPSREPQPEMIPDENDLSSPYPKPPGLKVEILKLLNRNRMSAEELSLALLSPVNSIRARLDRLHDAGQVYHDGAYPRTWGIVDLDGVRRNYASSPLGTYGKGFNQVVDASTTRLFAANARNNSRRYGVRTADE